MPIYELSQDAVLEAFDDGALVLIVPERRFVELNSSAFEIVKLLDGKRTSEQVANKIIKVHDISHDISVTQVLQDVMKLCVELAHSKVLKNLT